MNVFLWILQILLAAVFAGAGLAKLTQPKEKLRDRMGWVDTVPPTQVKALGAVEVLAAARAGPARPHRHRHRAHPAGRRRAGHRHARRDPGAPARAQRSTPEQRDHRGAADPRRRSSPGAASAVPASAATATGLAPRVAGCGPVSRAGVLSARRRRGRGALSPCGP